MMTFIINGENVHRSCPGLCMPMLWVNGNKARREPLVEDLRKTLPGTDYNQTLSELIEDRATAHDRLLEIKDTRRRAIGAMLLAHISIADIANIMNCDKRTIYRWKKSKVQDKGMVSFSGR
jgi:hypothetical protein